MIPENQLVCYATGERIELPEWMFAQFRDTIHELKCKLERDALDTPQYVQGLLT